MTATTFDVFSKISEYEAGELDGEQILELFQVLLDTGIVYSLQGSYQRTCNTLIQQELIFVK